MNRLRASLLQTSLVALVGACGLQCALNAQAQVGSPPPGKALVVLYRADKQPVAARVPVIANADRLGDIGNGEFVNVVVNPGRTFLRVGDRILTTLAIQANANRTSYVLIEAVPGLTPVRVEMREMTEAAARRALAQSRPAAARGLAAAPRVPAQVAPVVPRAPAAAVVPLAAAPAAGAPPPRPAPPRQAQASPPPRPAPPPRQYVREPQPPTDEEEEAEAELRKWRFAAIAKTGVFKLGTTTQTIGGLAANYDKSSKPVFGLEAEFRHQDGFAVGAELFYYKNDLTVPGTILQSQQTVISTTLNGKYYFGGSEGVFHPFVGAGVGFSGAKFGGDFTGRSSGPEFQGMLGMDLRFSGVGLYLEYKYLSATTSDSANQKIKTGGGGILAGVSVEF